MRPLQYQRRLPRSDLRLPHIFVKQASACFKPENRLVGVVERSLATRCKCQTKGPAYASRSRDLLKVVLSSLEASGWRSTFAGESWRRDGPESGGVWSASLFARTSESTVLVGGSRWLSGGPSSVPSLETASGGCPRLESRDLERALSDSWASRLRRDENPSQH